jgi:hypothetical protein
MVTEENFCRWRSLFVRYDMMYFYNLLCFSSYLSLLVKTGIDRNEIHISSTAGELLVNQKVTICFKKKKLTRFAQDVWITHKISNPEIA